MVCRSCRPTRCRRRRRHVGWQHPRPQHQQKASTWLPTWLLKDLGRSVVKRGSVGEVEMSREVVSVDESRSAWLASTASMYREDALSRHATGGGRPTRRSISEKYGRGSLVGRAAGTSKARRVREGATARHRSASARDVRFKMCELGRSKTSRGGS